MKPEEIDAWLARSLDDRRFSRSEPGPERIRRQSGFVDRPRVDTSPRVRSRPRGTQSAGRSPHFRLIEQVTRALEVVKTTDRPAVAEGFQPG